MNDEVKQAALEDIIITTYESMGMAILSIEPCAPASFKLSIIDAEGPRDVLVNVLLQMNYAPKR